MSWQKLASVLALCGLLATSVAADASLCRVMCASRISLRGSSAMHHDHHSPSMSASSSAPSQMSHHMKMDMPGSTMQNAWLALSAAPCAQYRQLAAWLDGSRTSLGVSSPADGLTTNLGAMQTDPSHLAIALGTESPSPPQLSLPQSAAPTQLRI